MIICALLVQEPPLADWIESATGDDRVVADDLSIELSNWKYCIRLVFHSRSRPGGSKYSPPAFLDGSGS